MKHADEWIMGRWRRDDGQEGLFVACPRCYGTYDLDPSTPGVIVCNRCKDVDPVVVFPKVEPQDGE